MFFDVNRRLLLAWALLALGSRCVAADDGDDFVNNLFSDLAPLLALFGERVTMQFMSQSMGWADNIILAMAPIGIITAVIGAIRVGGPSWLKAIIGRAKENLAVAEAELMSSTSKEVCEVWNGRETEKCMGTAPVVEFICLLPEDNPNDQAATELEVIGLEEALRSETKCLKKIDRDPETESLFQRPHFLSKIQAKCFRGGSPSDLEANETLEESEETIEEPSQKMSIIRNIAPGSPNISLNSYSQSGRWELLVVAAIGTILQLGVLVYSGFATYYPKLRFLKDNKPIANYAYPCTVAGTLVLVAGMMTCAYIVESSTEEQRYQAVDKRRMRIVWLQQTKTVSDQIFESCVVYAPDDRYSITTSRRPGDNKYYSSAGAKENHRTDSTGENPPWDLEVETIIGAGTSIGGFVLQFIGLRAMHWSASIAQLIAVSIMVVLRAWIRRRLVSPPKFEPISPDFELDWFAKSLGKVEQEAWSHSKGKYGKLDMGEKPIDGEISSEWVIVSGGESFLEEAGESRQDSNAVLDAQAVLEARKKLARLANWRGPASTEAVSLCRAIEVTMDALFGSSSKSRDSDSDSKKKDTDNKTLFWYLEACYAASKSQIRFRLRREGGKWKACADEIDAALSLWLSSVDDEASEDDASGESPSTEEQDDTWLCEKETLTKQSLRLLGPITKTLLRDLSWWVPRDLFNVFVFGVNKKSPHVLNMAAHRIVGCGREGETLNWQTRCWRTDLSESRYGNFTSDVWDEPEPRKSLLAAESRTPLKLLYAQDIYSAFVRAAAKEATTQPIPGGTEEIQHVGTIAINKNNYWQNFTLRNNHLKKMVQDVHSTGLGSVEQIYLSVIPPLSAGNKLPQLDAVVDLAFQHAKPHEQLQQWGEAGKLLEWLLELTATFSEQDKRSFVAKALAVMRGHQRALIRVQEFKVGQEYSEFEINEEKERIARNLEFDEGDCRSQILSSLDLLHDACGYTQLEEPAKYPESFNITGLHIKAQRQHNKAFEFLIYGPKRDSKDILGRTPLHYAAANAHIGTIKLPDWEAVDVNALDLAERTPLHYACLHGVESTVRQLIELGALLNIGARDGSTPLHYAAKGGHEHIVKLLIESGGATLDIVDFQGSSPLHLAAFHGHGAVVRFLWREGSKELRDRSGRTALHSAAIAGKTDALVELLVDRRADTEARDRAGETPLHLATHSRHNDIIRELLNHGADPDFQNHKGWTPLRCAVDESDMGEDVVKQLLNSGASTEVRDSNERTPLHAAVVYPGNLDVVQLLLDRGANIEATDYCGETAIGIAEWHGHEDILDMLFVRLLPGSL